VGLFGLFSCKDCVDVLRDYLDGEMTPADEAHFKSHVADCPPCMEFLDTYKATPGLCRKALAQRMPEELTSKLKAFLREKATLT
jgi:anti-sigma factor (TIGR02949 family)